jgi:TonB family protein
MNFRAFWKDENLFWEAVILSLGLHFLLFHMGEISFRLHEKHTVEIDITNMGHLGMAGAPKVAAPAPKPVVPPKEWIKPAPNQKVVPAAIPTKPVAPSPEETPPPPISIGTGEGGENILSRIPQLLNLSDLNAILRKFYPEEARAAGKESVVVLDLHIDTDGHVRSTDIIKSGGSDFDAAAQKAAALLRFTPAFMGSQRVAVKMRQAIQFKLESQ